MRGRQQILELFRCWDRRARSIALDELMQELSALALTAEDLAEAIGFDARAYRRTVIHSRAHYQALVLCWRSGQTSPIHDHLGSACAVKVVAGRATETHFAVAPCGRIQPVESQVHHTGSVTGCSGAHIHQMGNLEDSVGELVTLHVYSPPPLNWRTYRLRDTTLAGHDRLVRNPARTVRVELGEFGDIAPVPHFSQPTTEVWSWCI
jgi:cysteine dioxygenase